MKIGGKTTFFIGIISLYMTLLAQEVTHDVTVINIEVPVRVFNGNMFVENLTKDDFEIFEDGKIQNIEAVYLIKKTVIKRENEGKNIIPNVSRNFILDFEITEYIPEIDKVIDYFFDDVFMPDDTLIVASPVRFYSFINLKSEHFAKRENADQLKKQLRIDMQNYLPELRRLRRDLLDILAYDSYGRAGSQMLPHILTMIKEIRHVDQQRLIKFVNILKKIKGRKYVFLFYQKEVIPIPESQDYTLKDWDIDLSLDIENIKQAFCDSLITLNLIFITKAQEYIQELRRKLIVPTGIRMEEQSLNILSSFRNIVKATGGTVDIAINAASSFKRVVEASENYYLLYYSPINYRNDGQFKKIKVKVKNKNYKIIHREGYSAN